ncbi:hypothetical protein WUBG_00064 [Wuchereria bancrofti]|uniref:Uncharacterized protein n=1 Tax=Wuchereria bancrofti TaxID=6293 RepID=J9FNS2_WUCBA|nr:hypothetical protein WUBG_00064 [Wuchereria bancrofti]VDM13093.1 unnamed protein product [Wuchereria bancrofti]
MQDICPVLSIKHDTPWAGSGSFAREDFNSFQLLSNNEFRRLQRLTLHSLLAENFTSAASASFSKLWYWLGIPSGSDITCTVLYLLIHMTRKESANISHRTSAVYTVNISTNGSLYGDFMYRNSWKFRVWNSDVLITAE